MKPLVLERTTKVLLFSLFTSVITTYIYSFTMCNFLFCNNSSSTYEISSFHCSAFDMYVISGKIFLFYFSAAGTSSLHESSLALI